MKVFLAALFVLPLAALATPPVPGDPSDDVTFALGEDFVGQNFTTVTDAKFSDFSGKVLLIAYYTPW